MPTPTPLPSHPQFFESVVLPFLALALASDEIARRRVGLMVLASAINGTDGACLLPLARSLAAVRVCPFVFRAPCST
jgi:hypothetical protein